MEVKLAQTDAELDAVGDVLLQLRSNFEKQELIDRIKEQRKEGYTLAYVELDGEVISVAGFVICTKLAWGKHVYVDDLVTSKRYRSSGAGSLLIDWLKSYAREHGCDQIHLDSGVQRSSAHRFYLRKGFNIASHHFSMTHLTASG